MTTASSLDHAPRPFVLVGHCGPDAAMLRSAVARVVPGAPIEQVSGERSLAKWLGSRAVLLVNRRLDGDFESVEGLDLIRRVAGTTDAVLVSNLEDAQRDAVAAGARPGFGKAELYDDRTAGLLRELADAPSSPREAAHDAG